MITNKEIADRIRLIADEVEGGEYISIEFKDNMAIPMRLNETERHICLKILSGNQLLRLDYRTEIDD